MANKTEPTKIKEKKKRCINGCSSFLTIARTGCTTRDCTSMYQIIVWTWKQTRAQTKNTVRKRGIRIIVNMKSMLFSSYLHIHLRHNRSKNNRKIKNEQKIKRRKKKKMNGHKSLLPKYMSNIYQ